MNSTLVVDTTAPTHDSPAQPRKMARLVEFDHLRGLAIVLIVVGHSIVNSNAGFPLWLENLFRGGTGVFVFISGFFFHRIFAQRFHYSRFMTKKVLNVFVPFLCVSVVALAVKFGGFMLIDGLAAKPALIKTLAILHQGYVLFPHWYIPFIMLTFLCSPLHLAYLRQSLPVQMGLLLAFSAIALFIHRPTGNINPLQSLVYFTPFYLLGMIYSQYVEWLRAHYRSLFMLSLAVLVVMLWLQSFVHPHLGNYQKAAFTYAGMDLQFLQKMGLCIILIGFCEHWVWPALSRHLCMLATFSFAIFFLHPLIGMAWGNTYYYLIHHGYVEVSHTLTESLSLSLALLLIQIYGSLLLIKLLKPLLRDRSRLFIGC